MITNKRSCKNVSHIAWVSGITILLATAMIGCFVAFNALQFWDACDIYHDSDKTKTVTGLNGFYSPELQAIINECVYGTLPTPPANALHAWRALQTYDCSGISASYTEMWT